MRKVIVKNTSGLLSPIFYGVIPIIVLISLGGGGSFGNSFLNGAILTFLKDIWGIPLNIALMFIMGKHLDFGKLLKSKAGFFAAVAGLFGGPIGYTFYNTAFYLAGPSFGHVFTSLEPVILVISVYILYKRKFNAMILTGVLITTLAVISLVFGGALTGDRASNIVLGSTLGILGASSWVLESIYFEKALKASPKADVNSLVLIKMITAILINISLFIPVISVALSHFTLGYGRIGQTFLNANFLWRMILGGILLFFGRIFFFRSIGKIGPTITNVLYELSIIVTPILSMLVFAVTNNYVGHDDQLLHWQFQLVFWITTIGILTGIFLVIVGQNNGHLKHILE